MLVRAKRGFRDAAPDDREYQGISEDETYLVLEVSSDSYRVWDRADEPVIYPKHFFDVVDARVPPGWVFMEVEDDYRLRPEATSARGFYEDYFGDDGDVTAQAAARARVVGMLARTRDTLGDEYVPFTNRALSFLRQHGT